MRLDPSQIGDPLRQLGGGATDAAHGQQTARHGAAAEAESAFEAVDSLLLRRLTVESLEEAAEVAGSFSDARSLLESTRAQILENPDVARAAQGELDRARLRDLLGGA